MPTDKNILLQGKVLDALQEKAVRTGQSLDEIAAQMVLEGLKNSRLSRVQAVIAKGRQYGQASGIVEEDVVDVIRKDRLERSR
jgi:methionine salvage enolase-phosphatase E1